MYVVASAGIPPLTVVKSGGKWNKKQKCVTYDKIIQHYKDGILTEQKCLDPGNEPCPKVGTVGFEWNYVEDVIKENLETHNMTTGTLQYNDATIYYKNARLVYDEELNDYHKASSEVKGVEYNATAFFKK